MDRNLRAFLVVAKTGNLTVAADKIGLTQPALTKTIRRLERDFGGALFERSTRGMRLTHLGNALHARAQMIEMHYRQAQEETRAIKAGSVSHFRIGAGASYHMSVAPNLVKQLMQEFPETRFVLDFEVPSTTLPKLVDGEIDLILAALHGRPPEGIEIREVLNVEIVVYCCRTNPLARAGALSPKQLEDQRWIIDKHDHRMAERLEAYFAEFRLSSPSVVLECGALASSFAIARGSSYLTLAPASLETMAHRAGLVRLELEQPIWKFASGAWFRASWLDIPILRRSLELLPAIVGRNAGPVDPASAADL